MLANDTQVSLDAVLNAITDGVVVADEQGRLKLFNPAAKRLIGIGKTDCALEDWSKTYGIYQSDGGALCPTEQLPLVRALQGESVEREEYLIRNAALSKPIWISARAAPIRDEHGDNRGGVVVFHDITSQKKTEQELYRYAEKLESINEMLELTSRMDDLTGLLGRRAFDQELALNVTLAEQSRVPLSLILLDADHFKSINDNYGHLAGDIALKGIATILLETLEESEVAVRFGGEEFAVILPCTTYEQSLEMAEQLRQAISRACFEFQETQIRITTSVGVASLQPGDDANELFHRADVALYAAKESGRNCTCSYDGSSCEIINQGELASLPPDVKKNRRAWTRLRVPHVNAETELRTGELVVSVSLVDESPGGVGMLVAESARLTLGQQLQWTHNNELVTGTIRHMRVFSDGLWHVGVAFQRVAAGSKT